jgi:hypothetical protein
MSKDVKLIVEEHSDGFVAYPVGLRGIIVGRATRGSRQSPM